MIICDKCGLKSKDNPTRISFKCESRITGDAIETPINTLMDLCLTCSRVMIADIKRIVDSRCKRVLSMDVEKS